MTLIQSTSATTRPGHPRLRRRFRRRLRLAGVATALVGLTAAGVGPASANTSPTGCGTAHLVNSAPIKDKWGDRVGTLKQYWGWCNGNLRNWAHVHFSVGESWQTKVSIQTIDGVKHGVRTAGYSKDFPSKPTATMNQRTRARVEGTMLAAGQHTVELKVGVTAYTN